MSQRTGAFLFLALVVPLHFVLAILASIPLHIFPLEGSTGEHVVPLALLLVLVAVAVPALQFKLTGQTSVSHPWTALFIAMICALAARVPVLIGMATPTASAFLSAGLMILLYGWLIRHALQR